MTVRFSTAGRLALLCTVLFALVVGVAAWGSRVFEPWWLAWLLALLVTLPILWIGVHNVIGPSMRIVRALTDGADSFKDNDFSVSIATGRNDELGALVAAHNRLGAALRDERQTLFQRELLLNTVIQTTDIALLLANMNDRVVYSNAAARQLFNEGRPVNGLELSVLLKRMPAAFGEIVATGRNGLFTLEDDEPQTYHLSQNEFTLNAQPHQLYLFKHLTEELSRQEVATWKKVIRVISHELNNSLAPISSLAHSGRALLDKSGGDDRLETIFRTIDDRSAHLKNFIASYARFARLPSPRIEAVEWRPMLQQLQTSIGFTLVEPLPDSLLYVDPAQFEQVLINLLKNAHESGSAVDDIRVSVTTDERNVLLTIEDRGGGINDDVMQNALLPFYSTKKSGTGLGLPLCREIVEAHGGRLTLINVANEGLRVRLQIPLQAPLRE